MRIVYFNDIRDLHKAIDVHDHVVAEAVRVQKEFVAHVSREHDETNARRLRPNVQALQDVDHEGLGQVPVSGARFLDAARRVEHDDQVEDVVLAHWKHKHAQLWRHALCHATSHATKDLQVATIELE